MKILADMNSALSGATANMPHNSGFDVVTVLNWVYAFAGLVAVGFIVYGAVNYAMTQGEPQKIKQASQTIAFAVIGLVAVLLAAAITTFVSSAAGNSA